MINALNKGWKWLFGSLLTLLGFSSCDRFLKEMYGCPYADYKLVGDVKDAKGKPIKGVRVVYTPYPDVPDWKDANDTLYTDANGHFASGQLKIQDWPETSTVRFEDVDGSANGFFKTRVLTGDDLVQEQTKKGDKSWYRGEFTIHANAVLEAGE